MSAAREADAPDWLAELQAGFARSMRTPRILREDGYDYHSAGYDLAVRAAMVDGPVLDGLQRLQVYNQQYWFRLLTVLQGELPLTRRRMGLARFNALAMAYLDAHPSRHPGLEHLIDRLGDYLAARSDVGPALREAAELDVYHARAFDAAEHREFDGSEIPPEAVPRLLQSPLRLQSAWYLYRETHDNVAARRRAVAEREDETPLPAQAVPPRHWVIHRDAAGQVREEPLTPVQAALLARITAGEPLAAACDALATEVGAEGQAALEAGIGGWFRRWTALGWFRAPG